MESSASIDARNQFHWTELFLAVQYGFEAVFRTLIHAGADVNANEEDGWYLTLILCKFCFCVIRRFLFVFFVYQIKGWQPLHLAAENGHEKIATILIDAGATVDAKNKYDW